jgi:hypothetical protein
MKNREKAGKVVREQIIFVGDVMSKKHRDKDSQANHDSHEKHEGHESAHKEAPHKKFVAQTKQASVPVVVFLVIGIIVGLLVGASASVIAQDSQGGFAEAEGSGLFERQLFHGANEGRGNEFCR